MESSMLLPPLGCEPPLPPLPPELPLPLGLVLLLLLSLVSRFVWLLEATLLPLASRPSASCTAPMESSMLLPPLGCEPPLPPEPPEPLGLVRLLLLSLVPTFVWLLEATLLPLRSMPSQTCTAPMESSMLLPPLGCEPPLPPEPPEPLGLLLLLLLSLVSRFVWLLEATLLPLRSRPSPSCTAPMESSMLLPPLGCEPPLPPEPPEPLGLLLL